MILIDVVGKEGTEGTTYTYTLDINDMNSVGRATKKKDAKNFAFRLVASAHMRLVKFYGLHNI